jgi:hypothetical protein
VSSFISVPSGLGAPIMATMGSTAGIFFCASEPPPLLDEFHVGTFIDFMRLPSLSTSDVLFASSGTTA